MSVSPARQLALRVLDKLVRVGDAPVQAELDAALRFSPLCAADRALATELVYGALRLRSRLDFVVERLLANPGKTPFLVRLILAVAAYELLYLDKIPAYATVSAAVDLARGELGAGAARVVNGVLRSLVRAIEADAAAFSPARLAEEAGGGLKGIARAAAVPLWILKLWRQAYGDERMHALAAAAGCRPWTCVRVNLARSDGTALLTELTALPGTVRVGTAGVRFAPGKRPAGLDGLIRAGRVSVQGAGSLLALEALGLGERKGILWDACAGHGGKTFALLERGVPVAAASDTSAARLDGLRREAGRLGIACPPLVLASAAEPPFSFSFRPDTILIDAPCSGLGTLARHPDLRIRREPSHLAGLADLQAAILEAAWRQLAPGGRLAYITCTVNPDENERRIEGLLSAHPEAELLRRHVPEPDDAGTDVMFGALVGKP